MRTKKSSPPLIFNLFKPPRVGSFDLLRSFKKIIADKNDKIGHFGTLDPFATGVLMVGVGGAAKLNDFIHSEMPKTYLAIGKLGVDTDSGDWEGEVKQVDGSRYIKEVIGRFDQNFIQEILAKKFNGTYLQAPPAFSATKFQGKPLHVWARQGVIIKKEPVERFIHQLEIVKWKFPYLSFRVTVSSGTYIRTLFQEIAQELGTVGSLVGLVRESIGEIHRKDSLKISDFKSANQIQSLGMKPEDVLRLPHLAWPSDREKAFLNGLVTNVWSDVDSKYAWVIGSDETNWGLVQNDSGSWKTLINFRAARAAHDGLE